LGRILIIDDDPMVCRLLQEHLTNEGYEVDMANQAEEGFERVLNKPPDLILLDVNMPDATGFQICGRLKQCPETHAIPIIMMTGAARFPNQQEIGRWMGASEYILKPFNVIEVGERIRRLIGTQQEASTPFPEAQIPLPTNAPIPSPDLAPRVPDEVEPIQYQPVNELVIPPQAAEPEPAEPAPTESPAPVEPAPKESPAPVEPAPKESPAPVESIPLAFEPPSFEPFPILAKTETPELMRRDVLHPPAPTTPSHRVELPRARAEAVADRPASRQPRTIFAWLIFAAHLAISMTGSAVTPDSETGLAQAATYVAGGWALLLGLLVGTAASLGVKLEARGALRILGWAAIPIVLRAAGDLAGRWTPSLSFFHPTINPDQLSPSTFWLRPLDIFELAAALILGLSLRRLPGGSVGKSIAAVLLIGLAWSLAGRGYFRPF
jgi:DNA-binding response OmpR family regulator